VLIYQVNDPTQPKVGVLARASLYAYTVYFCYICKGQITSLKLLKMMALTSW